MNTEQFRKNNPSNTSPSTKCHFFCLGKETRAGAVFPLNRATKGRDISLYKNPRARLSNVKFVKGPDGTRDGAVRFAGRRNSYVEFPNRGKLDAKDAITLLAWIYHEGKQGTYLQLQDKRLGGALLDGWAKETFCEIYAATRPASGRLCCKPPCPSAQMDTRRRYIQQKKPASPDSSSAIDSWLQEELVVSACQPDSP